MNRSKMYDRLYAAADRVLKKHDPCAGCPVGCTNGIPVMHTKLWCCSGCKYLGPDGCTVQALACKLWLCSKATRNNPRAKRLLSRLQRLAGRYGFLVFRGSKEDNLKPLRR